MLLQQQLEEEAAKPPEEKAASPDPTAQEPKHQSIAQIIYAENRVSEQHPVDFSIITHPFTFIWTVPFEKVRRDIRGFHTDISGCYINLTSPLTVYGEKLQCMYI